MLEGDGRSEVPGADGEPLGRSASQELSTGAGCSEHPVPTEGAGGYNPRHAEPLVVLQV